MIVLFFYHCHYIFSSTMHFLRRSIPRVMNRLMLMWSTHSRRWWLQVGICCFDTTRLFTTKPSTTSTSRKVWVRKKKLYQCNRFQRWLLQSTFCFHAPKDPFPNLVPFCAKGHGRGSGDEVLPSLESCNSGGWGNKSGSRKRRSLWPGLTLLKLRMCLFLNYSFPRKEMMEF